MTDSESKPSLAVSLVKLARPQQWAKSGFVLFGPLYHLTDLDLDASGAWQQLIAPGLIAAAAFSLASSACYAINDVRDIDRDRKHPRKARRPVAAGHVSPAAAVGFAVVLYLASAACIFALPEAHRFWTAVAVGAYVVNVNIYSFFIKRIVIADVMGLSLGFVIRMVGGCAAVGIGPSTWLLNTTLFLAMFLAFGKRLGERRALGEGRDPAEFRAVQAGYTDEFLRMAVVVTGVATLFTYAAYTGAQDGRFTVGGEMPFNVLWLTIIPATYGLLRAMVLLEHGRYDDPTELAAKDRPFQLAALVFALISVVVILTVEQPGG